MTSMRNLVMRAMFRMMCGPVRRRLSIRGRMEGCGYAVLPCELPARRRRLRKVASDKPLLQDAPCIWFRREIAPTYNDFLTHQCQVAGLSPRTLQIGSDVSTILGLVAAGMGYSIVSDASTYHCPADVVLLDHPDLTMTYPVEFVWRTGDDNPVLARFVEALRSGLSGADDAAT